MLYTFPFRPARGARLGWTGTWEGPYSSNRGTLWTSYETAHDRMEYKIYFVGITEYTFPIVGHIGANRTALNIRGVVPPSNHVFFLTEASALALDRPRAPGLRMRLIPEWFRPCTDSSKLHDELSLYLAQM